MRRVDITSSSPRHNSRRRKASSLGLTRPRSILDIHDWLVPARRASERWETPWAWRVVRSRLDADMPQRYAITYQMLLASPFLAGDVFRVEDGRSAFTAAWPHHGAAITW